MLDNNKIEGLKNEIDKYQAIGNHAALSDCYMELSDIYYNEYLMEKAFHYIKQAGEIKNKISDYHGLLLCNKKAGYIFHYKAEYDKALVYYNQALNYAKQLGYLRDFVEISMSIGSIFGCLNNYSKAIEMLNTTLITAKQCNYKEAIAKCYVWMGELYDHQGNFQQGIESLHNALQVYRKLNDFNGISAVYKGFAKIYNHHGMYTKSLDYCQELKTFPGNHLENADIYLLFGVNLLHTGNYAESKKYLNSALKASIDSNSLVDQMYSYLNLAIISFELNELFESNQYINKSLEIAQNISKEVMSKCYNLLSDIHLSLNQIETAADYNSKALLLKQQISDETGFALCYCKRSQIHIIKQEWELAAECIKKAIPIFRKLANKSQWLNCYCSLGKIFMESGNFDKALYYLKKVTVQHDKMEIKSNLQTAYLFLSQIYNEHKQKPKTAFTYCKKSIELADSMFGNFFEEKTMIGFSYNIISCYRYLIPLCWKMKKDIEMFNYLQFCKSKVFLKMISSNPISPTHPPSEKTKTYFEEEAKYRISLRNIKMKHTVELPVSEISHIQNTLKNIYLKIQKFDPEYVLKRLGLPIEISAIKKWMENSVVPVTIVEYFTTTDEIFIFVIPYSDKKLHIEKISFGQDIKDNIDEYLKVMSNPFSKVDDSFQTLGNDLLIPIQDYINDNELVLISPYDKLHFLPFHALYWKGKTLIQKNPVAYLPSLSIINYLPRRSIHNKKSICLGINYSKTEEQYYHSLPDSDEEKEMYRKLKKVFESEAKEVAHYLHTSFLLGEKVCKETVCNALKENDILHFSCHGVFNPDDPLSSGLKLYDGILTAREIYTLTTHADLITLSACVTGLSLNTATDELMGLIRAFFYTGVSTIIAALWSVNAHSAKELMLLFYKYYMDKKINKALALQKAQIDLMKMNEYSLPHHWAPFLLFGNI